MDRKSFGRLVAALREELDWTQADLSELIDEDESAISNIERGTKKMFEPDLLYKLANAFQLTTMERREFFLAASGMEAQHIVRQPDRMAMKETPSTREVLTRMVGILSQLRVPAFLVDVFSDVIATNKALLDLLCISQEMIDSAPKLPGGYSTLRWSYGQEMNSTINEGFEDFSITSLRAFREVSLRYRAHPYFQYLIKEFRNPKKYPWFDRIWRKVSLLDDDKISNLDQFHYSHVVFGPLTYNAFSIVVNTTHGELFLVQYLPSDDHTAQVFEQIYRQGGAKVHRFAPWPDKKIIK